MNCNTRKSNNKKTANSYKDFGILYKMVQLKGFDSNEQFHQNGNNNWISKIEIKDIGRNNFFLYLLI